VGVAEGVGVAVAEGAGVPEGLGVLAAAGVAVAEGAGAEAAVTVTESDLLTAPLDSLYASSRYEYPPLAEMVPLSPGAASAFTLTVTVPEYVALVLLGIES
jgi:hypothetical protein